MKNCILRKIFISLQLQYFPPRYQLNLIQIIQIKLYNKRNQTYNNSKVKNNKWLRIIKRKYYTIFQYQFYQFSIKYQFLFYFLKKIYTYIYHFLNKITLQAQKKYEQQINILEERLVQASQFMNQMQDKVEDLEVDKMQNELEGLDKNLKMDIKKAEEEQTTLLEKTQKVDSLIDRLKKTTDIEEQQIQKMNEVLVVFKACSEQLQKEKDLLMLDNEKLVGEIEIFAKFFDENGPLLQELMKVKNEQQQQ